MIETSSGCRAVLLAYVLDLIVGDPQWLPHPVRVIGKAINWLEKLVRIYFNNLKTGGILLSVVVIIGVYIISWLIVFLANSTNELLGLIVSIVLIYTTISIKSLYQSAIHIYGALITDNLDLARYHVSHIVGRDTMDLDKDGIIRACIESIAESTVDGIVSPLFFAFIGGAPAALAYKAINTLDSMLGYKNDYYKDIGWSSAKIDDIANFIPARISLWLFPLAALFLGKNARQSLIVAFRDGQKHPSPNSGISEACVSGALGIQLGGINYYQGEMYLKPFIGDYRGKIQPKHIKESIHLMYGVSFLMLILGWLSNLIWMAIKF